MTILNSYAHRITPQQLHPDRRNPTFLIPNWHPVILQDVIFPLARLDHSERRM